MEQKDRLLAHALAALVAPGHTQQVGEFKVRRNEGGGEATISAEGFETKIRLAAPEAAGQAPRTYWVRRYGESWTWAHGFDARPRGAAGDMARAVALGRSILVAEAALGAPEPVAEVEFPSGTSMKFYLAMAFLRELERTIGEDGLRRIAAANAAEADPDVCHSHDLCDANVAMAAAFQQLFGFAPDVRSQTQTDMWNAAWNRFKLRLQELFPRERPLAPRG